MLKSLEQLLLKWKLSNPFNFWFKFFINIRLRHSLLQISYLLLLSILYWQVLWRQLCLMTYLYLIRNNLILFFIQKLNFRMAWIHNSRLPRLLNRILVLAIAAKTRIMNHPISPSKFLLPSFIYKRFAVLLLTRTQRYIQIKFIGLFRNRRHQSFIIILFCDIFLDQRLAKWCTLQTDLTINRFTLQIILYIYVRIYWDIEIRVIMLFF